MVEVRQVREVLRPRLGSVLAESPGFADGAAEVLNSWISHKETYQELARRMEDRLFNAMYDRLGPGMAVRMDSGVQRRIPLREVAEAADDLMGLLFLSQKPWSVSYERIHDYWIDTGSPAAMRCLYLQYKDMLPDAERAMIEQYLQENRL